MRFLSAAFVAIGLLAPSPVFAQASPSAYTTGYRYDSAHRLTGTISPDPDGAGPLHFAAVRNSYNDAGELVTVEKGELSSWKSESVAPASWGSAFSVRSTLTTEYDSMGHKVKEVLTGADGTKTVTQYGYDGFGRLECTAVRTDPAQWNSQPDACIAQTTSANGPDQITRNSYDAAGQLVLVQKGWGTADQANYAAYTWTANGKRKDVTDGNGNKAEFTYDGHDRLSKWTFPSKTVAGQLNSADYEQYGYDPNGNRTSLRKRDGSTLTYSYDGLNRVTKKTVPARTGLTADQTRDVYYGYDAEGRQLYARFDSGAAAADGVTNTYDGFGELTSSTLTMGTFSKTLTSAYDADGNRTQLVHPEGGSTYTFAYAYDGLDRLSAIDQGASSLDTFAYGSDGLVSSRSEGSGASSADYTWDDAGRLETQSDRFAGGSNVDWTLTYYPSSQVATDARSNSDYAFNTSEIGTVDRDYAVNGLNQYTSAGPASFTYDANGNLQGDGSWTYTWDVENRLVKAVQGATTVNLAYDPLGRLYQTDKGTSGTTTNFVYDADALALEYDDRGDVANRYVHGSNAAADDPLVWYSGRTLGVRYFLHADRLGSIAGIADQNGAKSVIQTYDEYGINGTRAKDERFGYTGQAYIPELGLYYYKTRFYSPSLGRFLQTDPIGYEGGMNIYGYASADPVNLIDPDGHGPLGWVVRLTAERIEKVRPFFSKAEGVEARKAGENILSRRQVSGEIERAHAKNKSGVMRHSGHNLRNGQKGLSHFQTEGKPGHSFYGTLTGIGAAILTRIDYYDRATNPFDGSGLSPNTCPAGGCTVLSQQLDQSAESTLNRSAAEPRNSTERSIDAARPVWERPRELQSCQEGHAAQC